MTMNIGDLTGFKINRWKEQPSDTFVLPSCKVGVEIEAENVDVNHAILEDGGGHWRVVADGSLRNNGVEFVLPEPMYGEDLEDALLSACEEGKRANWDMNERTSIHIHLDVRDMDTQQVFNILAYYLVFERAIYKFTSEFKREDSVFCLPYYKADFNLSRLMKVVDATNSMRLERALTDFNKYSGLNIISILQRGSLEFRHMEGTLDYNRIIDWINIIFSLKKASMEGQVDVTSLPTRFSMQGMEAVANEVFGEYAPLLVGYMNAERDMLKGVRVAQDAIYGLQYERWARKHKPTPFTGVSPLYANAMRVNDMDSEALEYKYNPDVAIENLFEQG